MKIIIDRKGNWNLWQGKGDFQSLFGTLKEEDLLSKNGILKSHIGKDFFVFEAKFPDKFMKLKRGPAVMGKKDAGIVISNTGINSESKIVEAGTGCGFMTAHFANISKNVFSYENNKDNFDIAKKNLEFLGLKAEMKLKDIYTGIDEKEADLIFLDLLEPWKVLDFAYDSLVSGGYFVCYATNINQVHELIKSNNKFIVERTIECLEREWEVDKIRARPSAQMLGHTGFLVFMRKC